MDRSGHIREAALELFTRKGFESTTMGDIGAAVGIRGPSLYKHVAAKQDLLVAIMVTTMEDLLTAHRAAVGGVAAPVERLRRATEAHVRFHARQGLVQYGDADAPPEADERRCDGARLQVSFQRLGAQFHQFREPRYRTVSGA